MAKKVSWGVELINRVSGPASEIVASVSGIVSAAQRAASIAAPAIATLGASASKAASDVAAASSQIQSAASGATKALEGMAPGASRGTRAVKKGADEAVQALNRLRSASRASAGATSLERGLNSFMPTSLLGGGTKKLNLFSRFIQSVGKRFGPRAAAGVMSTAESFSEAAGVIGPVLPVLGKAALGVAAVGAVMAVGATKLAFAGAKFVIDAQAFKQSTLIAFKLMLGSQKAADSMFQEATKFAAQTPFETGQVIGAYKSLLGGGFKAGEIKTVLSAIGDVAALQNFDPEVIGRMINSINKIKGQGKLAADELNEINAASGGTVARAAIYDVLAKKLGKTREQIIKLSEAGKIGADEGIGAILEVIRTKISGGKLGDLMKELSTTIPGLLSTLKGRPEELVFAIDEKHLKGMEMVRGLLEDVNELLDPTTESGKKVTEAIGEMFDAFIGGLLGTDRAANKAGLQKNLDALVTVAKTSAPALKELGASIRTIAQTVGEVSEITGKISEFAKPIGGIVGVLRYLSLPARLLAGLTLFPMLMPGVIKDVMSLGKVFDWIKGLSDEAGGRFDNWIRGIGASIATSASGLWESALSLGTAIIDGIVSGITGGISSVLEAIGGVATGAISWAKSLLGIASPSKVFEEIGMFTMAGFAGGVAANDTAPQMAIQQAIAPIAPIAMTSALPTAGAATGGLMTVSISMPITVQGNLDADAAERLRDAVRDEVSIHFESLAIQMGAIRAA